MSAKPCPPDTAAPSWAHVPPREAVLTRSELARWLGISERAALDLCIPVVFLARRAPRYPVWLVMEWLEKNAGPFGGENPK